MGRGGQPLGLYVQCQCVCLNPVADVNPESVNEESGEGGRGRERQTVV